MSGNPAESGIDQIVAGLDTLAAADVVALDDVQVSEQLRALVTITSRARAELVRRVDVFDRRGLAALDGFRATKGWLQAAARVSGVVAHRLVKAGRLLRGLPKLAAAFQSGDVPSETVEQVARLADQVGADRVAEIEPSLADAACQLDPAAFEVVCERVRAHLVPDGVGGDPAERFAKRAFTLSPVGDMVALAGQLDPEGGAALATALDAIMGPPDQGDDRTAAQRRADALVELARRPLAAGDLPTVGGQRPQVGVLLYPQALSPQTLAGLADAQRDGFTATRLRQFLTGVDPETSAPAGEAEQVPRRLFGRTAEAMQGDLTTPAEAAGVEAAGVEAAGVEAAGVEAAEAESADAKPAAAASSGSGDVHRPHRDPPAWSRPGWADPPHLNWFGPIPVETAQRIACDADFFRLILDPASGMPLDVGRSHRLVPHWIRRALWARDRRCRWTGCTVPLEWTDAHHLDPWVEAGETKVERLILLCRHHHGLAHEGGWSIDLDLHTGEVHITRPGGVPYLLSRSGSRSWNGPDTHA